MAYSGGVGLPTVPGGSPVLTTMPAPKPPAPGKPSKPVSSKPPSSKPRGPGRAPAPNYNNPLYQPGATLSGKGLADAALALAQAQYNPAIKQLTDQLAYDNRQAANQEKLTSQYFTGLGQFGQQAVQDERGISGQLNSTLAGIGQTGQDQLHAAGQSALDSLNKYTPGGTAADSGGTASLIQEMARQQGLAAQNQATMGSTGALQGANYGGLASANLGAYAAAGRQDLSKLASSNLVAQQPITSKIGQLRSDEGALYATKLGQLRQQQLNNQFTRQGLGLKGDALALTAQQDRAKNSLALNAQQLAQMRSDRIFQLDSKKFGAAQAKDAYLRSHQLGPYKPPKATPATPGPALPKTTPTGTPTLPPVTQERLFGQLDAARALIPQMQQPLSAKVAAKLGLPAGTRLNEGQIRQMLATGNNPAGARFNPALVDSAYALDGWGFLTNHQIVELNKLGLVVGNRYRRGNAPKAPPASNYGTGTATVNG